MKAKSKCTPASELRPRNGVEGYLTASAAAIWGDFLAFPIDTLKVRMQMQVSPLGTSLRSLAAGGTAAWYRGVHASAFRQATYGGMRLSLYEPIRNVIARITSGNRSNNLKLTTRSSSSKASTEPLSLGVQLLSGAIAGGVSSAVMCPADVVKLRLQAGEARYTSVSHALKQIVQHEGVLQLWRGVGPTSARASVVAAVELGLYDATKTWLVASRGMTEDATAYMLASVLATVGSIAVSFPIDVAKTVMINQGVLGVAASTNAHSTTANMHAQAHSSTSTLSSARSSALGVKRASSVGAPSLSNTSAAACLNSMHSSPPSAALHSSAAAAAAAAGAAASAPATTTTTAVPHYRHMLHVMWHRFETRGFVGMYRGVGPSLARQLVCNGGMFLGFEQLKKAFWEPSIQP